MLIKDIIHGIAVPFYSYNGSVKQQTYQLKLTLSSIIPPPPPKKINNDKWIIDNSPIPFTFFLPDKRTHLIRNSRNGLSLIHVGVFIFLFIFCMPLAAQMSDAVNDKRIETGAAQDVQNTQGEQSVPVAQESQSAVQGSAQVAETTAADSSDISGRWYTNFFISGGFQTFIPVSVLKEYTQAKPGYRAALGYTFFRSGKHTMPVYLETGHSVILGTNPLVRSFDAFPITVNAAYEYFPIRYLSLGVFAGIGAEVLRIRHYRTALDLLADKLNTQSGAEAVLTTGVTVGAAILERSIEVKAQVSINLMMEQSRVIPLPSFQLAIRLYPGAVYAYARKRRTAEYQVQACAKRIESLKTSIETKQEASLAVEKVPTAPEGKEDAKIPETKPLAQFKSIYVYFEPESAALDVNAKGDIKKAAAILKENEDLFILFESSAAPFGSQDERLQIETARIRSVAEYLTQKCGITHDRIIYNEPKDKNLQRDSRSGADEYYIQYRYAKIRFVRIQSNPDEGANSWAIPNAQ